MSHERVISRGGCHCGRIRFEADGEPTEVLVCNCSICTMKGYLHWFVPRTQFRLLSARATVATYTFNTGAARHHFCPECGVAPFYLPRSHPQAFDVNVRCLDGVDIDALETVRFDGKNWEQAFDDYVEKRG